MQSPEERLAFLRDRQGVLGGSDIAAVCQVDPYRSPFDVYLDKTRPVRDDDPDNIHKLRGVLLEPIGADLYSADSGNKLRRQKQRTHPAYPWAGVNMDRMILASDDRPTGALEVKAPGREGFHTLLNEGMKHPYILQLQWAMFVTGYEWGEFCAVNLEHGMGPIVYWPEERDEGLIAGMLERAEQFWTEHVEPRIPPNPDVWKPPPPIEVPEHSGDVVTLASPEVVKLAQGVMAAYRARRDAEAAYKTEKKKAIAMIAEIGATKLFIPGVGKMNNIWQPSRTYPQGDGWGKIKDYGAIDPDKLRRYLKEHWGEERESIDDLIEACGLDFEMFESTGNAYQQFTPYPAKVVAATPEGASR